MVTVSKELSRPFRARWREARRRRHEYVTLEHLLHAMTKDKVASEVLLACGADLKLLERELEEYLDRTLEALSVHAGPGADRGVPARAPARGDARAGRRPRADDAGNVLARCSASATRTRSTCSRSRASRGSTSSTTSRTASRRSSRRATACRRDARRRGRRRRPRPVKDPLETLLRRTSRARGAGQHRSADRPRRRARAHDPGAVPAPEEQPAARRRARRRQDRARRGPRAAHRREARCPKPLARRASTRSTWARCSPARSSAATSRSGSRPCMKALKKIPKAILFIDEIHTIIGAGATSGGTMDAANILKPPLRRASCAASARRRSRTTGRHSSAIARCRAASSASTSASRRSPRRSRSCEGLKTRYEEHHNVKYTDAAIARGRRAVGAPHQRRAPARQGDRRASTRPAPRCG